MTADGHRSTGEMEAPPLRRRGAGAARGWGYGAAGESAEGAASISPGMLAGRTRAGVTIP